MFIDELTEGTPENTPEETTEEVVVEEETPAEDTPAQEEAAEADQPDWEAEAKKWKAIATRASKKAEKVESAPTVGLSAKDFLALRDANVSAEDFDEVQEFASWKKISFAEALANPTLKAILRDRTEERRTAQATETKSPRGIAKSSGEDLLLKAEKTGEVPTTDEGIAALVAARLERKRRKN